jgi:hypothetical protein
LYDDTVIFRVSDAVIARLKLNSTRRVQAVEVNRGEVQELKPSTQDDTLVGWIVAPPDDGKSNLIFGVPMFISTTQ